MHLKYRNVNDAFEGIVTGIQDGLIPTIKVPSRNGDVLKIGEPLVLTYERPKERVLFNSARDCNPFFHLFESMWMLSGSNQLKPLLKYVSTFGDFSDDGETLNGAYGYRWRKASNWLELRNNPNLFIDQLDIIVDHLKKNPNSRRAVLQMWNVEDDLMAVDESKDVCCNTAVYFSIRTEVYDVDTGGQRPEGEFYETSEEVKFLDMTVTNRSNDIVWGMLGANAVHFSFLQEYMADRIGVEVGVYNQISNDAHVYLERWTPEKWLKPSDDIDYEDLTPLKVSRKLVEDPEVFDKEVCMLVNERDYTRNYSEPFLQNVVVPTLTAFQLHKDRKYNLALSQIYSIESEDWREVCSNWIAKRKRNWEKKECI
jgi:thymidylate synthase